MKLGDDLGIGKVLLGDGIVWAFGHAAATAVTLGRGHLGRFALLHRDGVVRALGGADAALFALRGDAAVFPDHGHDGLDLPLIGVEDARRT